MDSDLEIVQLLKSDDPAALTIWREDHPKLTIGIPGFKISVRSAALLLRAIKVISSLILTGGEVGVSHLSAAVQSYDPRLIQLIDSYIPNVADSSQAVRLAADLRLGNIFSFLGGKTETAQSHFNFTEAREVVALSHLHWPLQHGRLYG
jgi:hypothetical protein